MENGVEWRAELTSAVDASNVRTADELLATGPKTDKSDPRYLAPGDLLALAARTTNAAMVQLLVRHAGNDMDNCEDATLLQTAAHHGVVGVQVFLAIKEDLEVKDRNGETALFKAAVGGLPTRVAALADRGADVNAANRNGVTALHAAAALGHIAVVEALLDKGANLDATDENGRHALRYLYEQHPSTNDPEEGVLLTARLLVSRGLTVPDEDDTTESERHQGLLAAIFGWVKELNDGAEQLTLLPSEIVARGPTDVKAFFESSNAVLFRKKLCVVGPSRWGKTSFIQTMTKGVAACVGTDDSTVGIELSSWDFPWMHKDPMTSAPVETQYNVSLWDFAGQNDYQSTHSLFFSRRTMYVLCVDLKAYADEMEKAGGVDAAADSPEMNDFVVENIFRWIRVICAREPDSEFVFVGTKADCVDAATIKSIAIDLSQRVNDAEKDRAERLNQEIAKLESEIQERKQNYGDDTAQSGEEIATLKSLATKPPRFLSTELLVVSSKAYDGITEARDMLRLLIVESGTSFPMPKLYNEVRELLRDKVDRMKDCQSTSDKIHELFVDAESLQNELAGNSRFSRLSPDVIRAILHVLHDLGDVLWFDQASQLLSKIIFLSPKMVIDFIRELINHSITGPMRFNRNLRELQRYIKNEGCVKHDLLVELDMWKTVSTVRPLMLQLKELLLHFNLAYPANQGGMNWDSDLMVPMYWRKYSLAHPSESRQPDTKDMGQSAHWKYVFRYHLPENLFERYMAQSYSVICPSQLLLSSNALDAISTDEWHVRVSMPVGSESEMNIHVWAVNLDEMWFQLARFVMGLEKLLDGYPGLWVTRNVVHKNGRLQKLEDLLSAREESRRDKVRCEAQVVDTSDKLLPPKMEWYTRKRWRDRIDQSSSGSADGTELDKQMIAVKSLGREILARMGSIRATVKNTSNGINTLKKLIADQPHRAYPALWTLEWKEDAPIGQLKFALQLRSHLSGNCFHSPIELTVPSTFFAKYGVAIKGALTVCAAVEPLLGTNIAGAMRSGVNAKLDHAAAVHDIAKSLNLSSGNSIDAEKVRWLPQATKVAMLCDLLKIRYGKDFDPMRMSDISCLVCGLTEDGAIIWASPSEIESGDWSGVSLYHDHVTGVYTNPTTAQDESKPPPLVELSEMGSSGSPQTPSTPVVSEEVEASQTFHHSSSSTKPASPEERISARGTDSVPVTSDGSVTGTETSPAHTATPEDDTSDHTSPQATPQVNGPAGSTGSHPDPVMSEDVKAASLATQASQQTNSPTVSVSLNRSETSATSLRILGADNLPNVRHVGTQRPYCKWEIVNSQGVRVAFGRTERDGNNSSSPRWNQPFHIPLTDDQVARSDFKLLIIVKTPTLFIRKTIGEAEWTISSGSGTNEKKVPLQVED